MFFKLIKAHLLVSEIYIYQNGRCNDKNKQIMNEERERYVFQHGTDGRNIYQLHTAQTTILKMMNVGLI